MDLDRLKRAPKRVAQDLRIISLTKNWKEILRAKAKNEPYLTIKFRNGVVLNSPPQVSLNFLFHEIWIDEFYSGKGYEIKPNETVVDIGANIGVFAMWAATRAKGVSVHSYEPFPANAEFFAANQKLSRVDSVKFQVAAVADVTGTRRLQVEDSWILHSLADKGSEAKGLEVQCVSLDEAFAEIDVCHFLKLDCEGGEYEILYAASDESLNKVERIICEFNVLDRELRNGESLAGFLEGKGFVIDELKELDENSGLIRARRNR